MARGLGNMFGFEFLKNFDYPYISKSDHGILAALAYIARHLVPRICLYPAGRQPARPGPADPLNLLIVWLLTGLWHGASWNFVLWGLYFGLLLIFEKFFLLKVLERLPAFFSHLYALFFIVLGWVLFDFTDLSAMGSDPHGMFSLRSGWISTEALPGSFFIFRCLPSQFLHACRSENVFTTVSKMRAGAGPQKLGVCTAVLFLCTASLVRQTYNPFLYFRF